MPESDGDLGTCCPPGLYTSAQAHSWHLQGFCLSDKDLEPLDVVHKPNPRSPKNGAPMSLYLQTEA